MTPELSPQGGEFLDELNALLKGQTSAGTGFVVTLRNGDSVLALDVGDGLRLLRPTVVPNVDGGSLLAIRHAIDDFARALAPHTDPATQRLLTLVQDVAAIHVTEQLKEAIRPAWADDPPPRVIEELARSAATARQKLGSGALVDLPAPDVASHLCWLVTNLLLCPQVFDQAENVACDGCGTVLPAARWAYTALRDDGRASGACFCTDCANRRPLAIARLLFSFMPYDNSAVIEMFNGLTSLTVQERFRSELSNVASAIRDALITEDLLERPGRPLALLPREYEDAEHYAHVPVEQALMRLGVDRRRVDGFLRAWKRGVERRKAERDKRQSQRSR